MSGLSGRSSHSPLARDEAGLALTLVLAAFLAVRYLGAFFLRGRLRGGLSNLLSATPWALGFGRFGG